MSLFSQIAILVASLLGILCGIALAYIAPEELNPGRKYFLSLKWLLWVGLIITSAYFFYEANMYPTMVILIIAYLILYFIEMSSLNRYLFIIDYLILIIVYLMLPEKQMILATLIFIYGLPTGTLLIVHKNHNQKTDETKTG